VARLAERLRTYMPPISRLVASDLPRAVQSAEVVAAALGLPVERDPRWRERAYGALEGLPPERRKALREAMGEEQAGAEPTLAFHERVRGALLSLASESRVTAVISHGGVIRAVVRQLRDGRLAAQGAPPPLEAIANASVFHLVCEGGRFATMLFNDVAHLPAGEVRREDEGEREALSDREKTR
jgi:2,3-bisphosphoglycerate-dependent phosphoglycerate mutase